MCRCVCDSANAELLFRKRRIESAHLLYRLLVTARYFPSARRNLITHDTNYIVCDFGDVAEQCHHRGMNGASMVSHG